MQVRGSYICVLSSLVRLLGCAYRPTWVIDFAEVRLSCSEVVDTQAEQAEQAAQAARLGRAVKAWIDDVLGIDRAEVVRRSGLSDAKLRSIERGDAVALRRSTLRKLSRGLDWPDRAAEMIRDGDMDLADVVVTRGGSHEETTDLLARAAPDEFGPRPRSTTAMLVDWVTALERRVEVLEDVTERLRRSERSTDAPRP